jgi:hypothetical protein
MCVCVHIYHMYSVYVMHVYLFVLLFVYIIVSVFKYGHLCVSVRIYHRFSGMLFVHIYVCMCIFITDLACTLGACSVDECEGHEGQSHTYTHTHTIHLFVYTHILHT